MDGLVQKSPLFKDYRPQSVLPPIRSPMPLFKNLQCTLPHEEGLVF